VHLGLGPDGAISLDDGETAPGHESWIVKFPALTDPVDIGPVELAYATMAQAAGLVMAPCRLLPARHGPGHFATRRFDRPAPGQRLHMVSLAGAVEAPPHLPALDYDGFLRATLAITRDARDVGGLSPHGVQCPGLQPRRSHRATCLSDGRGGHLAPRPGL
jgi:serine/threonine-protein kinase HipA